MKNLAFLLFSILLFNSCDETIDGPLIPLTADDYIGTWNVNESCAKNTYQVTISAVSGDTTSVYISNFGQLGNDIKAKADISDDLITVLSQNLDGSQVSGTGTYYNEKITWSFKINDGADLIECSATYTK
jgi:hypothetical protein